MSWLDGITDSMDMSLNKPREGDSEGQGSLLQSMGSQRWDRTEQLNDNIASKLLGSYGFRKAFSTEKYVY